MNGFVSSNTYSVLIPKNSKKPLEDGKFVKDGRFSIFAGIFQVFWALYHKMWLCAAAMILAQACLMTLESNDLIPIEFQILLRGTLFFIIALFANDWRKDDLEAKGYVFVDVVIAIDEMQAQEKFLRSYIDDEYEALAT